MTVGLVWATISRSFFLGAGSGPFLFRSQSVVLPFSASDLAASSLETVVMLSVNSLKSLDFAASAL